MKDKKNHIGLNIKRLRNQLKLTQDEFVVGLGVSRSYLSQVEGGITSASEEFVKSIEKKYNVSNEMLESIEDNAIDIREVDYLKKRVKDLEEYNSLLIRIIESKLIDTNNETKLNIQP